jgi:hypothetical protein
VFLKQLVMEGEAAANTAQQDALLGAVATRDAWRGSIQRP